MDTTTKKALAHSVAAAPECTQHLASKLVDTLFTVMGAHLSAGHRIEIRGFGVWEVRDTKAKPAARNPRTGEIIYVPPRRKTHFKPGKELKAVLHQPLQPAPAEPLTQEDAMAKGAAREKREYKTVEMATRQKQQWEAKSYQVTRRGQVLYLKK